MIKDVVKIYGSDLLLFVIIPDYRFAGHHAIASVTQRRNESSFLFLAKYQKKSHPRRYLRTE